MAAGSNQRTGWSHRMKSFQSKQADINRLIMKYLVAEGYLDVAQGFEAVARLESGAQADPVEYQERIRKAVRTAQVQYAIDMAKRLYPKLFESENYMYFHMQQLRLIELIRERNLERNSGSGVSVETEPSAESSLGDDLLQHSCRQQVSHELESTLLKYEQTASMEPKMMFLVKLILWAQSRLDKDGCAGRCQLDLEAADFEVELKRALQND
ncbi:glucose-induced degradation protein 8 homolog isoform X2 [Drosophila virilis]|nr:glucose-induced degradation protein 8 homolog isoform X2 [Drosophila virilis]EDW61305.1 uncharacterized protein Dvir_GJ20371, isoform A [Drosophila virilis]